MATGDKMWVVTCDGLAFHPGGVAMETRISSASCGPKYMLVKTLRYLHQQLVDMYMIMTNLFKIYNNIVYISLLFEQLCAKKCPDQNALGFNVKNISDLVCDYDIDLNNFNPSQSVIMSFNVFIMHYIM